MRRTLFYRLSRCLFGAERIESPAPEKEGDNAGASNAKYRARCIKRLNQPDIGRRERERKKEEEKVFLGIGRKEKHSRNNNNPSLSV